MNLNIENLVRSGVVLVVGLPVTLGINTALGTADRLTTLAENAAVTPQKESIIADTKGELIGPCINFLVSKVDSKLERDAKNQIEEVLGGEVSHKEVCKWVF